MRTTSEGEHRVTWQLQRSLLEVTGPDARRFLNGQLTQDVATMRVGQSHAACLVDHKGKLVAAPLFVHLFGSPDGETFLIDGPAELEEALFARLDRYLIADDCELRPAGEKFKVFHTVPGGAASDATGSPTPAPWLHEVANRFRFGFGSGVDRVAAASGHEAETMAVAPSDETEWRRVSAGLPAWGKELGPDTLPAEAGLDTFAVSFTKGCYLGQEVISRIKSVGRVNRRLYTLRPVDPLPAHGLTLELPAPLDCVGSDRPAPPPDPSHDPDRRPAGHLTSVASRAGEVRALGFVSRAAAATGGLLQTRSTEKMLACRFEIGPPAPAPDLVRREDTADLQS